MKKLLFGLILLFAFASCEEIPPEVTGSMGGTNPSDEQQRQVLIEEFTGVRCVNCPAGSTAIEDLLAVHGKQLVAMSIHAGEYAPPYAESQYDFRTPEGDQLLIYLGAPFGFPSAVVNRKLYDGEFDLQLGQNQWAGYIEQELNELPKVTIEIASAFDAATRKLDVEIALKILEDIADPDVRLSLAITESDIQDMQLTPSGKVADYTHRHVLRKMMTNFSGYPLAQPLTAGKQLTEHFTTHLSEDVDELHCTLIAYVSLGGEKKEVLQAHQTKVLE